MRPVYGMREADRPILRILDDSGLALRPTSIQYNLDSRYSIEVKDATLYRRLNHLTFADLLTKEEDTYYAITELGVRLLEDDLDDEEVAEVSHRLKEGPD